MRGEDERKDEIKQSRSEEEGKGPKQGQGEGEGRCYIVMFSFREEKLSRVSFQQQTAQPTHQHSSSSRNMKHQDDQVDQGDIENKRKYKFYKSCSRAGKEGRPLRT